MPRKKAESDDESTSVKRRTRTKSQAVEETAAAEAQAAPAEAADGEETQVKKKRSYARKPAAAEGEEETKPRRGRKKKEEAEAQAAPEAAEAEEQKPAKRGRRVKEADEPRQETIFGADSLADAFTILSSVFRPYGGALSSLGLDWQEWLIALLGMALMLAVGIVKERGISVRDKMSQAVLPVRWASYLAVAVFIVMFGAYGDLYSVVPFIYGNF